MKETLDMSFVLIVAILSVEGEATIFDGVPGPNLHVPGAVKWGLSKGLYEVHLMTFVSM
jgi:hypothetical protein